ncbi:thiamine diphosphokinase [Rhizobium sp. P32RR-XVIII]|uniref:thiamine diphosphokinase n=1 Tax=Rhizobium sp. P32RR-XVIII TaxID=2726738 RepID=UPI001FEFD98E|nr:thiamine diphosphokinase [Rhizobium sp. P32RR-XVIII]
MPMSQSIFTILLGGELVLTERLRGAVLGSRFIAADGGMRHAAALGVVPELWVGDFDSTPADLAGAFPDVPRQPYPTAKAATDGEIAVSEAIARGARRLVLAGALSGERSDHALQHLLYAVSLAEQGFDVLLTSGKEEAVPLIPGSMEIDLPKSSLFSVSGFSELRGLHIENARYPLADFHLPFGSSRTISNVAEGKVRFTLGSGRAIVLARPYDLSGV